MWKGRRVSVVFPTYNEKESIRAAIDDFFAAGHVDEIVVVDNNAAEGTDNEVRATSARLVFEPRQGYGYAIWRGLAEATGDILIISEPDGTFSGHDVLKLLAYSDDMPVVFGSRTSSGFVWGGANMGFLLKAGNWSVPKMTKVLFNTTILTDVGCSMRLLRRDTYELPQARRGVIRYWRQGPGRPARHRNDRHDPPLPHSLLVRLASTAARSARDRRRRQANELTLAIHRVRRHEWGVRVPADTP